MLVILAILMTPDLHAELLDGCLDAVDLLSQPAVQSPLRHGLSVQSLQAAGDSLEHRLVALSGDRPAVTLLNIKVFQCVFMNFASILCIIHF